MEILDKIYSKEDQTIKYVFRLNDGLITEVAYINKQDGKDIICVSCQTGCNLGCKFCHTSDGVGKIEVRNLRHGEIRDAVDYVFHDLDLGKQLLLVSYMGCGEPLMNHGHVIASMDDIRHYVPNSRFAIATMIPKSRWPEFFLMTREIKDKKLNVKMHLSLHFTDENMRQNWMPAALEIKPAIEALKFYREITGNSIEVHYTLIEGENDAPENAQKLAKLCCDVPIKVLQYNTRKCLEYLSSRDQLLFRTELAKCGHTQHEYYVPPGADCGASCGAFLLDYYLKYNFTGK